MLEVIFLSLGITNMVLVLIILALIIAAIIVVETVAFIITIIAIYELAKIQNQLK